MLLMMFLKAFKATMAKMPYIAEEPEVPPQRKRKRQVQRRRKKAAEEDDNDPNDNSFDLEPDEGGESEASNSKKKRKKSNSADTIDNNVDAIDARQEEAPGQMEPCPYDVLRQNNIRERMRIMKENGVIPHSEAKQIWEESDKD